MTDKQELINARLGKLGLGTHREEEILRELSDHLEDHAATLEARGVASDAAAREGLNSVADWPLLREEIVAAEMGETKMNYRTKVLWLPASFALAMTSGLLALIQHAGFLPRFYWFGMSSSTPYLNHRVGLMWVPVTPSLTPYIPWLIALPLIGAVAAFWSQRAGGKSSHRMLAALAPSLGWFYFLLASPVIPVLVQTIMYLLKLQHGGNGPSFVSLLTTNVTLLLSLVLGPPLLLFIGAVPFLRKHQAQV
jgi:hypothetical protein